MSNPVTPMSPLERALLNMIAAPESAGRYDVRYTPRGGARFNLNGVHPRIFEPGPAGPSSAAGRYQFTWSTWRDLMGANTPFTPANQDRGALLLARQRYKQATGRDIFTDLQANKVNDVARTLGPTWAGLRDNPNKAIRAYYTTLGTNTPASAPPPGVAAGPPSPPNGPAAPNIALANAIPTIGSPIDPLAMAAGEAVAAPPMMAEAARRRRAEEAKRTADLLSIDANSLASLYA